MFNYLVLAILPLCTHKIEAAAAKVQAVTLTKAPGRPLIIAGNECGFIGNCPDCNCTLVGTVKI